MGIYSADGMTVITAHDIDGHNIFVGYDINGVFVYGEQPDYTNYSYTQKWASKSISNAQGFDIYDGKIYWVSKSGNSSEDNAMYIYNLTDGSLDRQIAAYGGHGNCVTFARTKYAESDPVPTMLISTAYTNPSYKVRLDSGYDASILQRIKLPVDGTIAESPENGVTNGGYDVCYGETDDVIYSASVWGSNSSDGTKITIGKWDMTQLTDNGDGTYTPTLLSYVNCDWHYWKQGIKYHDGLIWLCSGYPNYAAYIYAIDPTTGETVYTIDCETTTEIEGAVFYPDSDAAGGYALYVGFSGMMLRKYTFAAAS